MAFGNGFRKCHSFYSFGHYRSIHSLAHKFVEAVRIALRRVDKPNCSKFLMQQNLKLSLMSFPEDRVKLNELDSAALLAKAI